MIDEIKEVLIRNGILTSEELNEIAEEVKKGGKFEDLVLNRGKIKKDELQKLIFNLLYFEKKNFFKVLEEFITDANKYEKYLKMIKDKKGSDKEFVESLLINNVVSDEDIAKTKAQYYNIDYYSIDKIKLDEKSINYMKEFDKEYIRKNKFIVIGEKGTKLLVGVWEPENIEISEEVSLKLKKHVIQASISKSTFENLYNAFMNSLKLAEGAAGVTQEEEEKDDVSKVEDLKNEENPIVKLVSTIITESVRKGASDIHIEPYKNRIKVKNRIDGVLIEESSNTQKTYHNMIISRIKILSNLNIAEHRIPQDGRFKMNIEGKEIDLRVSIIPTAFGESVVLRILDKKDGQLSLVTLGVEEEDRKILIRNGQKPYGMVLITGPTGSGKTTTLYALLSDIKKKEEKFITIEDPVEYQIEDIVQIPVNEKTGLTFAKGLRAILRQDPDKVMVGEIRDKETAEIAVQAALTGHLVLSTIHANNTVEAVGRLINIGIDPYQFTTALNLIVGQRLMRRICSECKGEGCAKCDYTGHKGRTGVYEMFELNQEIKQMIIEGQSLLKIQEKAIADGMITIEEKAAEKVRRKITSIEEYERIVGAWEGEEEENV